MPRPGQRHADVYILHLETGRHLYGGPRQVLDLMAGLREAGVRSTLACPRGSAIAQAACQAGLETITHDIGGDLDVSTATWLARVLRHRHPDLLHVHSRRGADLWGALAARMAGVPALLTRRVDNPEVPLLGALKYRAYDAIVAISGAVRRQLLADGVPAARLSVIHSAVDPATCQADGPREAFLAEFGLHAGQRVVMAVAQLIPRKGIGLLLEAWPMIRHACPDARLLIFGSGPLEATLRPVAGLGGTVTFAGQREHVRRLIGHADLVVHPALREGLGVSLIEAQAAGVAVVAFASGGVPEVVVDGETGLLVPAGDTAALATAVIALLDDPNRRQALGRAGARRIRAAFGIDRMVQAYVARYEALLAGRRRQAA